MTGVWATADVITAARMNEKTLFIGTGAAIAGLATTYPGMIAICTSTGSGFTVNFSYRRNAANDAWKMATAITGEIKMWGGGYASPPSGYLLCDGSAVSRTTYADLFAVISTSFGVGNGSTTFNLPDLRAKFPRGAPASTEAGGIGGEDTHTLTVAELPSHGHTLQGSTTGSQTLATYSLAASKGLDSTTTVNQTGNTGSGTAHENRPAYQQVQFIIAI